MTHITCRLTAKNRDQLRNPTIGNLHLPLYLLSIFLFDTTSAQNPQKSHLLRIISVQFRCVVLRRRIVCESGFADKHACSVKVSSAIA